MSVQPKDLAMGKCSTTRLRSLWAAGVAAGLLVAGPVSAQEVQFYHLDAIGNVRAVTDAAGQVVERHDYLPFGEECTTGPCANNPGTTGGQPKHFTGKERDAETGLDYFGARYYRSNLGRFATVDPAMNASLGLYDPQKWNRYAYGRNNPFRNVDPNGQDWTDVVNGAANAFGSNGLAGAGRVNPHNDDYATGQFIGDVLSIPGGLFEAGTGAAVGTGGTLATVGSAGSGSPVSVPIAAAGAAMVVQGGTQIIAGALNAGIYLSKRQGDWTGATRKEVDAANAERNGGSNACDHCGKPLEKVANKKGVPTPENQLQRHHKVPLREGQPPGQTGPSTPDNAEVLCPGCHKEMHQ